MESSSRMADLSASRDLWTRVFDQVTYVQARKYVGGFLYIVFRMHILALKSKIQRSEPRLPTNYLD